jgi:hypothetical protein
MFTPSIVPAIDQPHSISGRHAKEFLAGQGVVAEAAQHAAGDQVGAGLVYAAGGHAVMRRLDDHANALRLEDIVDALNRPIGPMVFRSAVQPSLFAISARI